MNLTVIYLLCVGVLASVTALVVPTTSAAVSTVQRFQADTVLDMLGKSFDTNLAFTDLLSALHRRLNLDTRSQLNRSGSVIAGGRPTIASVLADTAVNCLEAPATKGASVTYTSYSRAQGSSALYQCDPGYNGRSKFLQCGQGGQWSMPVDWEGCVPVDCGPVTPDVPNADTSFTTTDFLSVVVYTCQSGYKMNVTDANVTCLETGNWERPSFVCEKENNAQYPKMAALLKSIQELAEMLNLPNTGQTLSTTATTQPTTTTTTANPETYTQPGGFRQENLMTLASLGLGAANQAAVPNDINQLLGVLNPMSQFGGTTGSNVGVPNRLGTFTASRAGTVTHDPELLAEQREEMIFRALMASAMKSLMGPSWQTNRTSKYNPALDLMALMALQHRLGGSGGGGAGGAIGASGGFDPLSLLFGGVGLFGQV